jgi:predicted MFS family arabinose efflux permease
MNSTSQSLPPSTSPTASKALILLLGLAVGVIVANLYYAQPLVALIASALGLDPAAAGLIVTLTQVGYGLGVLFIVPLGDLIENRKLILTLMVTAVFALLGLALSSQIVPYFLAALAVGIAACSVQIIVPYAAHLTPEATRGRVVGSLMSGLMLGIMLSRPIASLLTDLISWHAVFYLSAGLMVLLGLALYKFLPPRQPANLNLKYQDLIGSMAQLFLRTPLLRRRAVYQAFMFAAFCLFWTATPLLLSGPDFHLSQTGIALFALAGVAGAVVAPLAGRLADHGWSRAGTVMAMASGCLAFLMTHLVPLGSVTSLVLLVISAILLDAGVTANLVLGQRAIFSLRAKYRSRLNGLYIATIFVGGAFGSSVGAWAYAHGSWYLTSWVGFTLPLAGLLYFGTEWLTGFQKKKSISRSITAAKT